MAISAAINSTEVKTIRNSH